MDISQFINEFGEVRLRQVRGAGLDLNIAEDRAQLKAGYARWVLDDNYVAVKKTTVRNELAQQPAGPPVKVEYQLCKARKRGNDVDARRTDRQMSALKDAISPYCSQDQDGAGYRLRRTRTVYVTLTVDPLLFDHDLTAAWDSIGMLWNRFLANLRRRCGTVTASVDRDKLRSVQSPARISVVRSWESHESGWPHIHAILCFEDYAWGIIQDSKLRWRVKDKHVFEDAWPFGFLDVVALTPGTLERNIENVLWYVGKNLSGQDYRLVDSWPEKRRLTQATLWYLGKRAYSVTSPRRSVPFDEQTQFCQSLLDAREADLIKRTSITQTDLAGNPVVLEEIRWEFLGLVRGSDTELGAEDWFKAYSDPPDWLPRVWKPCKSCGGLGWASSWGN